MAKDKRPGRPRGPTHEPPDLTEAARLELDALRAELGLPLDDEAPEPTEPDPPTPSTDPPTKEGT